MYIHVFYILAILLIIYKQFKPNTMTEAETTEFANLNTKLDGLTTAVNSSLSALAETKAALAQLQSTTSDADVIAALQAAEAKLDANVTAINTALTPAG